MFKNTIFMGLTTAAKMLSGIVVFVVMARLLGPHDFGLVAYSFTLASLFVLIVDYGFSQQLLRDIGADPHKVEDIMGRVFVAKLLLGCLTLILCEFYIYFVGVDSQASIVFWLLLISCIFASFCEFFNTALRAVGLYKIETNIAVAGSLVHFFILLIFMLIKPNVIVVSSAFLCSRVIFFTLSWLSYKTNVGNLQINFNLRDINQTFKLGLPYAADAGFSNFLQQVDTLIVNHYLGVGSVGLYQAATKWVQGSLQFAPVLANVFLPSIAASPQHSAKQVNLIKKLNVQMIILGAVWWVFFEFAAETLSMKIYGDKFRSINELWPFLGVLVFVRYCAGSLGVILTGMGFQKIRLYAQFSGFLVLVLVSPYIVKGFGLPGMVIAQTLSITALVISYLFFGAKKKIKFSYSPFMVVLIAFILLITTCLFITKK
ncbi:oligosaccharide flippase family protein [Methylophilus sp. 13]|uniref:oligosaccharide flippase family protein n=1 Tax=Methylophilus sp. 13 TaxID=2781018 RepID=UPI00188DF1A4|nr:oligosaccharide flippase family protein [Methylophilus sp. 13]MBF5038003.1 oligosaccharide flippase family protein [Methylophilus sp. 13]